MGYLIVALIGLLALLNYLRKSKIIGKQLPAGKKTVTVKQAQEVKQMKFGDWHVFYFWNPQTGKWGYVFYFSRKAETYTIPFEYVRKIRGAIKDKNWTKATSLLLKVIKEYPKYYKVQEAVKV